MFGATPVSPRDTWMLSVADADHIARATAGQANTVAFRPPLGDATFVIIWRLSGKMRQHIDSNFWQPTGVNALSFQWNGDRTRIG